MKRYDKGAAADTPPGASAVKTSGGCLNVNECARLMTAGETAGSNRHERARGSKEIDEDRENGERKSKQFMETADKVSLLQENNVPVVRGPGSSSDSPA